MTLWIRGRVGQPVGGVIHHGGLLGRTLWGASVSPSLTMFFPRDDGWPACARSARASLPFALQYAKIYSVMLRYPMAN